METTIEYEIPSDNPGIFVELSIYNISGQKICTLVSNKKSSGIYSARWNGIDKNGRDVSTGIYFAKLKAESSLSVKKILLVK